MSKWWAEAVVGVEKASASHERNATVQWRMKHHVVPSEKFRFIFRGQRAKEQLNAARCDARHETPTPFPAVSQWMCFDACPVHACLPYVAGRIAEVTPDAKIVVMLRNPVKGLFSAEVKSYIDLVGSVA